MAEPSVQGRFIWEGLMTEDPAGASAFYSKVVGWRTEPWPSDPTYTIFAAKSGPVAGMSALTDALREQGVRGHWLAFIGADDVDAVAASAEKLGAKIMRPAWDIPEVGRAAILGDPQGAAFALFKPLPRPTSAAPKGAPQNGEFAWQELSTTDAEAALKFYSELFGWQLISRMDMGAMGFYLIFGADGVQRGGIFKSSHPGPGPHWLPYAEVPDVQKAAAAVTKGGGSVLNGPMDVPGGRIVQLADPSGVVFAVHSAAKSAASAPPPKPANAPASAPAAAPGQSASSPPPPPPPPPSKPKPKPAVKPAPKPPEPTASAPASAPTAIPAAKPALAKAAPAKAAPAKTAPAKAAPPAAKKVARKTAKKTTAKKKAVASKKAAPKKAAKKVAKKVAKTAAEKAAKKKLAKKKTAARAAPSARKAAPATKKGKGKGDKKKDKKNKKKDKKGKKRDKARRKK